MAPQIITGYIDSVLEPVLYYKSLLLRTYGALIVWALLGSYYTSVLKPVLYWARVQLTYHPTKITQNDPIKAKPNGNSS